MDNIKEANYWDRFDELSIFQAVSLIIGHDPRNYQSHDIEDDKFVIVPREYMQLKNLIINAVKSKVIEANIDYNQHRDGTSINVDNTMVDVQSLKDFL